VTWAILNLSVGITAFYAWRIEARLGAPKTVMLFTFILVAGYAGMSLTGNFTGLGILLLFYLARGVATPTLRNYINQITTSDIRATVLSVRNFIIRMLFAILGPFFGWMTDAWGLSTAMLLAGLIFALMSGISLWFFLHYRGHGMTRTEGIS
jgi:hypothetical protein